MSKKANRKLLRAVLEPRKPGAIEAISEAIAAGADPNALCPELSNSRGHIPAGHTLLTLSISQESARAAEKLLAGGADPNLADANGWTPWMASTLVDGAKREQLQALLQEYEADTGGSDIESLAKAIHDGDVHRAQQLLGAPGDLQLLENFRVDLVRQQISVQHTEMLAWLLAQGMHAGHEHLSSAVRARFLAGVELLLAHGLAPEKEGDTDTLLMTAAGLGDRAIVECLLEAGADPCRGSQGNIEWTADYHARMAGHQELADWLVTRMDPVFLQQRRALQDVRDPRFAMLYEHGIASEDHSTEAIVAVLTEWDDAYGIEVGGDARSVEVRFRSLPEPLEPLLAQILDLCPNLMGDAAGVRRALSDSKAITLWWD